MIYQRHDYGLVCKLRIWGKLACPVFRQTRVVKRITLTYLMVIHVRVCKSETIWSFYMLSICYYRVYMLFYMYMFISFSGWALRSSWISLIYIYIYTTDITYLEFGSMAIPGTNLLEVPIIYNAYVSKGIYHQNMALHGTVPPFRILEFPLIVRRSFQSAGGGLKLAPSDRNGFHFHLLVDKRTAGLFCKVDSENLILTNSTFSRGWRI